MICVFHFNRRGQHGSDINIFGLLGHYYLRSYHYGACLLQCYFDKCIVNVLQYHAADTGHDTPSCHNIETRDTSCHCLSIGVEHHTGIHNHPFLSHTGIHNPPLWSDSTKKSFLEPSTHEGNA